jgi:hypothetical protein
MWYDVQYIYKGTYSKDYGDSIVVWDTSRFVEDNGDKLDTCVEYGNWTLIYPGRKDTTDADRFMLNNYRRREGPARYDLYASDYTRKWSFYSHSYSTKDSVYWYGNNAERNDTSTFSLDSGSVLFEYKDGFDLNIHNYSSQFTHIDSSILDTSKQPYTFLSPRGDSLTRYPRKLINGMVHEKDKYDFTAKKGMYYGSISGEVNHVYAVNGVENRCSSCYSKVLIGNIYNENGHVVGSIEVIDLHTVTIKDSNGVIVK